MSKVVWVSVLVQLSLVIAVDEALDGAAQGVNTPGEAARATSQASQVVTQVGIAAFDRIGLALV